MSVKIVMTLEGTQSVQALFNRMPAALRTQARGAIEETTRAVEQGAKMRVPVSSGGRESRKARRRPGPGELRDTIRSRIIEDEGGVAGFVLAGYGKLPRRLKGKATSKRTKAAKARRQKRTMGPLTREEAKLGAYAMVIEYGSPREGKAAQPYLRPALEAEKPRHQQRMARAIQRAVVLESRRAGGVA